MSKPTRLSEATRGYQSMRYMKFHAGVSIVRGKEVECCEGLLVWLPLTPSPAVNTLFEPFSNTHTHFTQYIILNTFMWVGKHACYFKKGICNKIPSIDETPKVSG